jgi:hypothetical protein
MCVVTASPIVFIHATTAQSVQFLGHGLEDPHTVVLFPRHCCYWKCQNCFWVPPSLLFQE